MQLSSNLEWQQTRTTLKGTATHPQTIRPPSGGVIPPTYLVVKSSGKHVVGTIHGGCGFVYTKQTSTTRKKVEFVHGEWSLSDGLQHYSLARLNTSPSAKRATRLLHASRSVVLQVQQWQLPVLRRAPVVASCTSTLRVGCLSCVLLLPHNMGALDGATLDVVHAGQQRACPHHNVEPVA